MAVAGRLPADLLGDYLMLHFALYGVLSAAGLWLAKQRVSRARAVRPRALAFAAISAGVCGGFAIGLLLDRCVTGLAPIGIRGALRVAFVIY